jgi:hypothetical protein
MVELTILYFSRSSHCKVSHIQHFSMEYPHIPVQLEQYLPNLTLHARFTGLLTELFFVMGELKLKTLTGCRHNFQGPHAAHRPCVDLY